MNSFIKQTGLVHLLPRLEILLINVFLLVEAVAHVNNLPLPKNMG